MAHKCEWCFMTVQELLEQEDEYTADMARCDARSEALGGSLRCSAVDQDEVDTLNARAAACEDDRAFVRICLAARDAV